LGTIARSWPKKRTRPNGKFWRTCWLSIRWLETVAAHAADEFVWPAPFTLEMQSCGSPNARWDLATHKLTLCTKLAADFADLYRSYGNGLGARLADSAKAKTVGASATTLNRRQAKQRRKLSR
jgi:Putative metallopeptidase